jgi:tRNA(His) guanylyltransferase
MDKTSIGDRMKMYEASTESRVLPRLPIIVRIDGRSFSNFCKGMKRPFDDEFRQAMIETTKYLVERTHAKIGYTQSDEINLVIYTENLKAGSTIFDGRVQKIASNFASMASVKFLIEMQKRFPDKIKNGVLPTFDARVFVVPSKVEAYNCILWRTNDATKNSISMVAQSQFPHKELQGLSCDEMQNKLLTEKDINWNNYTSAEKQGTYIRKEKIEVTLTEDELSRIPEKYRPDNNTVTRSNVIIMDMPIFHKLDNPIGLIFDGEAPRLKSLSVDIA